MSDPAVPLPEPPYARFDAVAPDRSPLRAAITVAKLRPETECLPPLIAAATLPPEVATRVAATATRLVETLRAKPRPQGVEGLIHEYALSSEEGVSLMCLAEALLRIPDAPTRDALIRDKIATGDWLAHVRVDNTLFVNAATWGLAVTGRLLHPIDQRGLYGALTRLVARGGEPLIRSAVDLAMRLMGEQFVSGETIEAALANGRKLTSRGFTHSYDMLGEAAATEADATAYLAAYEAAIDAIGESAAGLGPYRGPGISIKLTALHPRYERAQAERVHTELLPRLKSLAERARRYDIGLNIDAEEADRLELSLDLLEALARDPALDGWKGLGFVVQAYGKRCPFVIDWLADLARRTGRRLMVRLVKGAYWDAEIKAAQVKGLADFPVYTRKVHTDVAYIACAKKLLDAREFLFPQFATHNAQTLATILELAGPDFSIGDYEFQCLHGMGESLYDEVVGADKLSRPCRIYAPVGPHERLLAYLVRRLLENGANSSFVNRIADPAVPVAALIADPVARAQAIVPIGAPHPAIRRPSDILGERRNSAGLDLADETVLARLGDSLAGSAELDWTASPGLISGWAGTGADRAASLPSPLRGGVGGRGPSTLSAAGETPTRLPPPSPQGGGEPKSAPVCNPANRDDIVGRVVMATPAEVTAAIDRAVAAAPACAARPPAERAVLLRAAADRFEADAENLIGLMVREAGKTVGNALGEVREAVDFLRYYADDAAQNFGNDTHPPLGVVAAISPWNFPLSIFTGQLSAALAAGNAVVAKPAEETPLTAAAAVRHLHAAGIPSEVLNFLPGAGDVGAALVADPRVMGVVFTGSTEVARLIQRQLAPRLLADGQPVPLIAETAGQNAMIVDSSALTEQVVADVLASAFDSAGQRCSALRLLCLQDDIADKTLAMLKGAMAELRVGDPARLATDVGPVITQEARERIAGHVTGMRGRGHAVHQSPLAPETAAGFFVPPTLIELSSIGELTHEVFGPVVHVLRYPRAGLDRLVEDINGLGYGLTFGLHTRLDETVERVTGHIRAGNIYVNRNIIGAVVGVQPFGGHGLSGTGPKAGGPLYLRRFVRKRPALARYRPGFRLALPGPVGESNDYTLEPRGTILAVVQTEAGLAIALDAIRSTGNRPLVMAPDDVGDATPPRPTDWFAVGAIDGVLVEGGEDAVRAACAAVAGREGPIVPVQPIGAIDTDLLLREVSLATNTAAAGGNASLMTLGDG